jgi:hypothetical protein
MDSDEIGIKIELQNLGDAQLCREITVNLSTPSGTGKAYGACRSVDSEPPRAGICASKTRMDLKRPYSLTGVAGEHEPAAIRTLVIRLMPPVRA